MSEGRADLLARLHVSEPHAAIRAAQEDTLAVSGQGRGMSRHLFGESLAAHRTIPNASDLNLGAAAVIPCGDDNGESVAVGAESKVQGNRFEGDGIEHLGGVLDLPQA